MEQRVGQVTTVAQNLVREQTFSNRGQTAYVRQFRTPHGGDEIAEVEVGERTVKSLRAVIADFERMGSYDEAPELYERWAEGLVALMAPALAAALHYVREVAPHAIVVRGLQIATAPVVTPTDGVVVQADCAVETAVLIGVARILGWSGFAYAFENGAMMLRAVCPVKQLAHTQSSQGADDLGSHQDNISQAILRSTDIHPQKHPPANRVQGFTAINTLASVPMCTVSLEDVLAIMRGRGWQAHIDALAKPEFSVKAPDSHNSALEIAGLPMLVMRDDGKIASRFHASNVTGQTPEAILGLHAFADALAKCGEMNWVGARGDLYFYDNTRTLHRRSEFKPVYDGRDRYYIRCYFDDRDAVAAMDAAVGGRVFEA